MMHGSDPITSTAASPPPRGRADLWWALASGMGLIALLYYRVVFLGKNIVSYCRYEYVGHDMWGANLVNGGMSVLHFLLRAGQWPVWDPSEACGKPILGDPTFKLLNPFQWLAAFYPSVIWLNFLLLAKLLLTYLFMWFYLRELRLNRWAAFMGAMAWIANGYLAGYLNHNQFDVVLAIPLAFWGVSRLCRDRPASGFALTLTALFLMLSGGNPQSALIGVAAVGLYGLMEIWSAWRARRRLAPLGLLALAGGCALLLYAPEGCALLAYHRCWITAHDASDWTHLTGGPALVAKMLIPAAAVSAGTGEGLSTFAFLAAALIVVSAPEWGRRRAALFFGLWVGVAFYLLCEKDLFDTLYARRLLGQLPLIREIRFAKYTETLFFGLSVLLAFSVHWLTTADAAIRRGTRYRQLGMSLLWSGTVAVLLWSALGRPVTEAGSCQRHALLALPYLLLYLAGFWWLTRTLLARVRDESEMARGDPAVGGTSAGPPPDPDVLSARAHGETIPGIWRRVSVAVLLALIVAEFVWVHWYFIRPQRSRRYMEAHASTVRHIPEAARFLLARRAETVAPFRFLDLCNALTPAVDNPYGLQQIEGGNAIQIRWYWDFFVNCVSGHRVGLLPPANLYPDSAIGPVAANPLVGLLNVKYALVQPEQAALLPSDWVRVATVSEPRAIEIYENPRVGPRAFVTDRVVGVGAYQEALAAYREDPSLATTAAYVVGYYPPARPATDAPLQAQVAFRRYRAHEVCLTATVNKAAFLVLTDTYFPGWRATVDGVAQPVYLANGAFRGLALGPGAHEVVFRYVPPGWPWSGGLSALGAALALATLRALRRGGRAPISRGRLKNDGLAMETDAE